VFNQAVTVKSLQPGPKLAIHDFLNEEVTLENIREDFENPDIQSDLDKLDLLKRRISAFNQSRRTTTLLRHYQCRIGKFPCDIFVGGLYQGGRALVLSIKIR
jgi:hypothetical protein